MSRFRLYPTPAQQAALLEQCRQARYLWNLAVEQWSMWKWAAVNVPKVGWVRVRLSRAIPEAKSYSVCGHCAPENRENQAVFRCVACGHRANADVNAAVNIAAGRAVSARRETPVRVSPKREPQLATSA
jgi:hypothetical protein